MDKIFISVFVTNFRNEFTYTEGFLLNIVGLCFCYVYHVG